MSLTKWFRKNNKKVFGVVTVIILFGFIGGGALMRNSNQNRIEAVATYDTGKEITNLDLHHARQELELLSQLGGDRALQSQDLGGVLLSELLFNDGRPNPNVTNYLMRLISARQINLSDQELVGFYNRSWPPAIYWILLRQEAQKAGISMSNDTVKKFLGEQLIPSITQQPNAYGSVMSSMVNRYGKPEKDILSTFGQLMSVLEYAQTVCSMENSSSIELQLAASQVKESITAEWVPFDSQTFSKLLDPNEKPSEEQIKAQFDKFKNSAPGQISDENPFGFGYQLPDRIQFEYLTIKLNDIAASLGKPSQQEAEQYYQRHVSDKYTISEKDDPDDPNSISHERTQSFSEVAQQIYEDLTAEAVIRKGEQILQEARNSADADIIGLPEDNRDLATLQEKAGQYDKIAQDLSNEHGVTIVYGKTGLLSHSELQKDRLARLNIYDQSSAIPLPQLLFQVEPVGIKTLSLLHVQAPKMYESVGPFKPNNVQNSRQYRGYTMALVRLVNVSPTEVPASVDTLYDNSMSSSTLSPTRTHFSVREQVISDLQSLAAFQLAEAKAQELGQLVAEKGWDQGIAQFNQTYGERLKGSVNADPNVIKLSEAEDLARTSTDRLVYLQQNALRDTSLFPMYRTIAAKSLLTDELYQLVAPTPDQTLDTQAVVTSAGQGMVYLVKHLSLAPLSKELYEENRGSLSNRQDMNQMQRLVALHLNPKNIECRWNLQSTRKTNDTPETQDASEATQ